MKYEFPNDTVVSKDPIEKNCGDQKKKTSKKSFWKSMTCVATVVYTWQ